MQYEVLDRFDVREAVQGVLPPNSGRTSDQFFFAVLSLEKWKYSLWCGAPKLSFLADLAATDDKYVGVLLR